MAVTNRERVGKAIDLLAAGLQPFVERELKAALGDQWRGALEDASGRRIQNPTPARRDKIQNPNLADPQLLLNVLWNHWNNVFARTLGHAERSLVSELREVRNR